MSLAIVPGSFDPMTLGHLELVKLAAAQYDRVVVAVMVNSAKDYLFSMEERIEIAKRTVAALPNVSVIGDTGMLIDLFDRLCADVIFKTYRNAQDLAYEQEMAAWNHAHNPRVKTEIVPASGEFPTLSSTQVRLALREGDFPFQWIHPDAVAIVQTKWKQGEHIK